MKNKTNSRMKSNLSSLLRKTNEAYYWMGFLLADGSFKNNKTRIVLNLGSKDKDHLKKFAEFISYTGSLKCGVAAMDTENVRHICKIYKIHNRKTYNPPVIPKLTKTHLYSLIIGFIDGDGSIIKLNKRKDAIFRIKCHKSWLGILNDFSEVLFNDRKAKVNNQGYAEISVVNNILLKKIKRNMLELKIPYLKRKWDNIDLSYENKIEKSVYNTKKTKHLLEDGFTNKNIAKKLHLAKSTITQIMKRNNWKRNEKL